MSVELKPCPHCGSAAAFRTVPSQLLGGEHPLAGMEYIDCTDKLCGASTIAMYSTGEDCKPLLAERWNRRLDASIKAAQPEPMSDELIRKIMSDCGIHPSEAFGEVWTGNVQLLQFARALLAVPLPSAYTMTAPRCCGRTMKFTGIWRGE